MSTGVPDLVLGSITSFDAKNAIHPNNSVVNATNYNWRFGDNGIQLPNGTFVPEDGESPPSSRKVTFVLGTGPVMIKLFESDTIEVIAKVRHGGMGINDFKEIVAGIRELLKLTNFTDKELGSYVREKAGAALYDGMEPSEIVKDRLKYMEFE